MLNSLYATSDVNEPQRETRVGGSSIQPLSNFHPSDVNGWPLIGWRLNQRERDIYEQRGATRSQGSSQNLADRNLRANAGCGFRDG